MQQKFAVIDAGIAAHVDNNLVGLKQPFGMGKLAGGDCSVIDEVMVRAGPLHNLAGESEGSGRGQNHAVGAQVKAGGCDHVIKAPGLRRQIVVSMTRLNVVVVGPTIETKVARNGALTSRRVVRNFIGPKNVSAVVNFSIAPQAIDVAVLFLLQGADGSGIRVLSCGLLCAERGLGELRSFCFPGLFRR